MTSIHFHLAVDGGCAFHRALQPVRFCHEELREHDIELSVSSEIKGTDWFVFHGLPTSWDTLHAILLLKRKGAKLCWSLDDDLSTIPDWNPAKISDDGMVVFDMMCRSVNAIIVSTERLKDVMHDHLVVIDKINGIHPSYVPVFTCPNLLDLKTFPDSIFDGSSFAETTVQWPIRFVWAGSATHKGDVAVIEDALIRLLDKHGSKTVAVIFAGLLPPPELMRRYLHDGCISGPSVPFNQYRRMANGLDPDVWLAPLADIQFNESKSHLRIMEGWALGSCVVASNVGEYARINHGEDGFLVGEEHWLNVLDQLVLDHQTRTQVSANGRARVKVECDWRIEANRKPWIDAIKSIAEM